MAELRPASATGGVVLASRRERLFSAPLQPLRGLALSAIVRFSPMHSASGSLHEFKSRAAALS